MIRASVSGFVVVGRADVASYRGVDREPWGIVEEAYYASAAPELVQRAFERMSRDDTRGLWWPSLPSRDDASMLLNFSKEEEPGCELIAVQSPYLRDARGRADRSEEVSEFLGFDVVSIGEWSLLKAIQFAGLRLPGAVATTPAGLLTRADDAIKVEYFYREASSVGAVEEIAGEGSGTAVEAVGVFLVGEAKAET